MALNLLWYNWTDIHPSLEWLPVFFHTLSMMFLAPIIFLTVLDIVAYTIARTVGQPHSHRNKSLVQGEKLIPTIHVSLPDTPTQEQHPQFPPPIGSTFQVSTPTPISNDFEHHFSSPSEGNFALSGQGIFSPPESRAGSPTLERNKRLPRVRSNSAAGATTTGSSESETESNQSTSTSPSTSISTLPSTDTSHAASMRHRRTNLKFTPLDSQNFK